MLAAIPTNEYIDGVSRNPELNGARQYIDSRALGGLLAFARAFYDEFGRKLYITEGSRSRPRQDYLWDNRVRLNIAVARPYGSRHDEVVHPNATDLGSGIATLGTPAQKWAAANAARFGGDWTGRHFNEAWHYEWAMSGVSATPGPVLLPTEEDDMPLNDDDKKWLRTMVAQERDSANGKIADIQTRVDQTYDRADSAALRLRGFDENFDMLQIILSKLGVPVTATVDAAAIARELAPMLDNVIDEMTDAEVERIAKRSADVLAARLTTPAP